uniref:PA14 domain-containing protein n=1 Tax=Bacteroides thetaiotaomicron TaxID=818 RepID=UPI001CD2DC83
MDGYENDMPGDGLMGEYFDNIYFAGAAYHQKDMSIDFDFTGASPAPHINNENFSIRWAGFILAPHTGNFNFIIDSDGA